MITQERVVSISGSRVQTDQGMRRCAGNAPIAVGDSVVVVGGLIMGWVRRWANRPQTIAPKHYRFADAQELKMRRVDEYFVEIGAEDIPRPAEDTGSAAVLVLHCYNESTEYLVWFIESRCIIQKDGATVADFESVFPPDEYVYFDEADGYINDSGDLIWGVYKNYTPDGAGHSVVKLFVYENGTVTSSLEFAPYDYEAALETRTLARAAAVNFSWSIVSTEDEVVEISEVYQGTAYTGYLYQASFDGCSIDESSIDAYCSTGGSMAADVLGGDMYVPEYGFGSVFIVADVDAQILKFGGTWVDDSFTLGVETLQTVNTTVFRQSDRGVFAEKQEDLNTDSEHRVALSLSAYIEAGGAVSSAGSVTADAPISASGFGLYFGQGCGEVGGYQATLTGKSGANIGVTRSGSISWVSKGYAYYEFSTNWPHSPAAGDQFEGTFYVSTYTWREQYGTLRLTASFASNPKEPEPIMTSVGNNYSLAKILKIESAYGFVSQRGELHYEGNKIYESPPNYILNGAWLTAPGKAIGLTTTALVVASEGDIEEPSPPLDPSSIVTKRFI